MSYVVGVARIRQLRVKSGKYPDAEENIAKTINPVIHAFSLTVPLHGTIYFSTFYKMKSGIFEFLNFEFWHSWELKG